MSAAPSITYTPGTLVRIRGREWVVQAGTSSECLRVRPMGGSEDEIAVVLPTLELELPQPAIFPQPDPSKRGNHTAALLLRDALQLKLRDGAGPFRSFAKIAVEPRAYQLVPLLMALRLSTVRLLIADDVGIGKTIEAGLIVRELLDRGEIARFAVLCPPHLVEQWQAELARHFHLQAVAVTASSISRLERDLPPGMNLFQQHSCAVVSLDYIKSDRHRAHFLSIAPECIVVDEAHTCSTGGQGRQLRFELLQHLAADESRHLLLLTATPHSGDDAAFHNLLSLLRVDFQHLADARETDRRKLREDLSLHFVQRRRKDIEEWHDSNVFPRRKTSEVTFSLTGDWGAFFDAVQDYCLGLAERNSTGSAQHLVWYATLALLRCVSSSPAAAERALTTRLAGEAVDGEALDDADRIQDGDGAELSLNDLEPAAALDESDQLRALIQQARALAGLAKDPKLKVLIDLLRSLLKDGFRPVVFCRYIATAGYVASELRSTFKSATVDAVTGELTPEEREERVQVLAESELPILVATDCLSEGVNLQHGFTAVVHYDLAWNPTRHEQREGRVDRFGQKAKEVRCTMIYGQDNPVDGFVLNVILRKAETIRRDLGVVVPLPQDQQRINSAMIKAALLKRNRRSSQLEFGFDQDVLRELRPVEAAWEDAYEKAKSNRTIFAQRRLKPEEVLPEWNRQLQLIGDESSIERFVKNACARLDSPLQSVGNYWRFQPRHLPLAIKERLSSEALEREMLIDFRYPPSPRAQFIHRTHPLVSILADHLVENSLQGIATLAARCAVTVTADVQVATSVFLLRLRYQLVHQRRSSSKALVAEETVALALEGRNNPRWLEDAAALRLLDAKPTSNVADFAADRELRQALDQLDANRDRLESLAHERAAALLADHKRVREAASDTGRYTVTPCLPVDVVGVYVLLPDSF